MSSRAWVLVIALVSACGGGGEVANDEASARTSGDERPRERNDGSSITGLMGTIAAAAVEQTLSPRLEHFMGCFERRMGEVEFLGGELRMSFRIHTDGSVAWVYPSASSVGDRSAEQCVLEMARRVRFPRPRGGEAEFSWGFTFDPPDDVRPPLSWSVDALGDLADRMTSLRSQCRPSGAYQVTAYIQPGGRVLTAGGSAPTAEAEPALECIVAQVRAWTVRDPGSYAAKVTFAVQ